MTAVVYAALLVLLIAAVCLVPVLGFADALSFAADIASFVALAVALGPPKLRGAVVATVVRAVLFAALCGVLVVTLVAPKVPVRRDEPGPAPLPSAIPSPRPGSVLPLPSTHEEPPRTTAAVPAVVSGTACCVVVVVDPACWTATTAHGRLAYAWSPAKGCDGVRHRFGVRPPSRSSRQAVLRLALHGAAPGTTVVAHVASAGGRVRQLTLDRAHPATAVVIADVADVRLEVGGPLPAISVRLDLRDVRGREARGL